jgi:7-carboxy-7-deazaguanine synthase
MAGKVTHFLRLGGCDYRCNWCDTMYAVDPAQVRLADDLDDFQVLARLDALAPAPMLVISGGNPALQHLDTLVYLLRDRYEIIALETQGSRYRPWLDRVDSLVVSPKPPSSGEANPRNLMQLARFMDRTDEHPGRVLKIVVFDDVDLDWARGIASLYETDPLYLSAGTDMDHADDFGELLSSVSDRYRWLCETVAADPTLHRARVMLQLHVIAWGQAVGV